MPVKTMASPRSSAAAMTSASRFDPPGWITGGGAGGGGGQEPVRKGKEGVGRDHAALRARARLAGGGRCIGGLLRGDPRGIDAAHLARADADCGAVLGVDDGVRLHVLGDGEGEQEVRTLLFRRRAPGHGLELVCRYPRRVLSLYQKAVVQRAHHQPRAARPAARAGQEKPQIALRRESGTRLVVGFRRDHDLGEESGDQARRRAVERPVGGDHAAEGAHRVAGPRLLVGGSEGAAESDAAGVAVLDDGDGGRIELAHQPIGRVGIGQVVVARLLALDQRGLGHTGGRRGIDVEGSDLMGVLAIAQHLAAGAAEGEAGGEAVVVCIGLRPEAAGDGGVISGRAREGRRRQAPAQGEAGGAAHAPPCRR